MINLPTMTIARFAAVGALLACAGCYYAPRPYYAPYPAYPVSAAPQPQVQQSAPQAAANAPGNCREFQQTVTIDGQERQAFGTTCLQPDGTWRVTPPQ